MFNDKNFKNILKYKEDYFGDVLTPDENLIYVETLMQAANFFIMYGVDEGLSLEALDEIKEIGLNANIIFNKLKERIKKDKKK